MVQTITKENINEVLNEVYAKLHDAELILGSPGCSTDEIGKIRCKALNSVTESMKTVENLIHNTYLL